MLKFPIHSKVLAALIAIAQNIGATMKEGDEDDDDDDEGGGASDEELAIQARRMLEKKGGSAEALAITLMTDNRKARAKARKANERVRELEKLVPKDGQVVVTKAESELLTKYKEHGTPDEVKTKIEKGVTLEKTVAETTRGAAIAEAATVAKLNGKLLAKLADPTRENFIVELRDETKDGKTVKVPFARKNEANAPFKPLADFAKNDLAEYYPALIAAGGGAGGSSGTTTTTNTEVVEQLPSGTAPASGMVDKFIENRNKTAAARPNPLAPPQAQPAKT